MQYNTFVTNKTIGVERVYVRLRGDKLQESENYSRLMNEMSMNLSLEKEESVGEGGKEGASASDKTKAGFGYSRKHEEEKRSRRVFACLVQGNFALIETSKPTPFGVEDVSKLTYLSVHDDEQMWLTDFPVSPGSYGCITIVGNKKDGIHAYPSNPKPVWIECKRGDPLPNLAIYAGKTDSHDALYFGRVTSYSGIPCEVDVSKDGKFCGNWSFFKDHHERREKKGDILKNTGYELVRANRGDQMPANAILTGTTANDGSLFVGRAGGNLPCRVSIKDGKIFNFRFGDRREHRNESGEILILINDPDY